MKIKILVLLNLLFLGLVAYLFLETKSIKDELNHAHSKFKNTSDSLQYYKYKSLGDSLILTEDYNGALEYFRLAGEIIQHHSLPEEREALIQLAKKRIESQKRLQNRVGFVQEKMAQLADSMVGEIHQKDSLMRLSQTEINNLLQQSGRLKDSIFRINAEKENLASSMGQIEFKTDEGITIYYAGDLKNGRASGHGYGIFATGGIYAGEWKDNKRHGNGKYIWKDGNIYEGEYRGDKRHGKGTYFFTSGEKYVGEWQENMRSGDGIMYGNKGEKIVSGKWKNDQIVDTES